MSTATKLKKNVEGLLAEWQELALKWNKREAKRLADIAPHKEKFDRRVAEINEVARATQAPLEAQMKLLAAQIDKEMQAGIAVDRKSAAVLAVESTAAIVELKDNGHRLIDPKAFFDETAEADRTSLFWSCLNVGIAKAEKFLPKAVMDRLAQHDPNWKVITRLKK